MVNVAVNIKYQHKNDVGSCDKPLSFEQIGQTAE